MDGEATVHATAVLAGAKAIVVRGAPGSGKSRLAFALISAARARLIADDQVRIMRRDGRLLCAPLARGAGLLEIRGLGIHTLAFEPLAQVALIADLAAPGPVERLPRPGALAACLLGVAVPRIAIARHDPQAAEICLAAAAHLAAGGRLETFIDG